MPIRYLRATGTVLISVLLASVFYQRYPPRGLSKRGKSSHDLFWSTYFPGQASSRFHRGRPGARWAQWAGLARDRQGLAQPCRAKRAPNMRLPTAARRLTQHQKGARKNGQITEITSTLTGRNLSALLRQRALPVSQTKTILILLQAWMPILPPDGLDKVISWNLAGLPIRSVYGRKRPSLAIDLRVRNPRSRETTSNIISRSELKYRHRHRFLETHLLRI
jgi:hypothetical protein